MSANTFTAKNVDFSTAHNINEVFKNPTNRRDPGLIHKFLDAVKKMLIHRYKSLEDAYKAFSEKGGLSQVQLDKMLKSIKINIGISSWNFIFVRMKELETVSKFYLHK